MCNKRRPTSYGTAYKHKKSENETNGISKDEKKIVHETLCEKPVSSSTTTTTTTATATTTTITGSGGGANGGIVIHINNVQVWKSKIEYGTHRHCRTHALPQNITLVTSNGLCQTRKQNENTDTRMREKERETLNRSSIKKNSFTFLYDPFMNAEGWMHRALNYCFIGVCRTYVRMAITYENVVQRNVWVMNIHVHRSSKVTMTRDCFPNATFAECIRSRCSEWVNSECTDYGRIWTTWHVLGCQINAKSPGIANSVRWTLHICK